MVSAYLDKPPRAVEDTLSHNQGPVFSVDSWTKLRRFLILGSTGGSYYANEHDLTKLNLNAVKECLVLDGLRVVEQIVEVSHAGLAPKNDPALVALAMATCHPDLTVRRGAYAALPLVARTGTHLLHFMAYCDGRRGWGRALRRAVGKWFTDQKPDDLAYQAMKYPSRDGWALSDALRLTHPKPPTQEISAVLKWIVDGLDGFPENWTLPERLMAVERLKTEKDSSKAAQLIRDFRLPREVVPTHLLNEIEIWDALLQDMPLHAMVRNLNKMTEVGLVKDGSAASARVRAVLGRQDAIVRARLHPLTLLVALKTYEQGHGTLGKLRWSPVKAVITALDEAFYLAFGSVRPSNKRVRLAVDVSGSMTWPQSQIASMNGITSRDVAAAMALVTMATEPQAELVAFSHTMVPLQIRATDRLDAVIKEMGKVSAGYTYVDLPITDAINARRSDIDAFVTYTDSETGTSLMTADQALVAYRQQSGRRQACHAVVAMAANDISVANPSDPRQMDFVGMDTSVPALLTSFILGEV